MDDATPVTYSSENEAVERLGHATRTLSDQGTWDLLTRHLSKQDKLFAARILTRVFTVRADKQIPTCQEMSVCPPGSS